MNARQRRKWKRAIGGNPELKRYAEIWTTTGNWYENNNRSGRMALGYVIMLPREQRDELWAKFQVEKGE